MKKSILLAVLLVFVTFGVTAANPLPWGGIDPCGDAGGTNHFMFDTGTGLMSVYIVHQAQYTMGVAGARFSAPAPFCLFGTYMSETHPFATVGDSRTGIEVLYGACMGSPVHVLTINFFVQGLTPECCMYWTLPYQGIPSGRVEQMNCDGTWNYAYGGGGFINPDSRSWCGTPVEQKTWGGIKALYR